MFLLPFLPFILTIFAFSPHLESPLCSPEREYNTNGLRKENRQTHVHLPATFFATCSLHSSIKQWTDFPRRYISYQKSLQSQPPMICFASPFAFFHPALAKQFSSACFVSHLFLSFYRCGSVTVTASPCHTQDSCACLSSPHPHAFLLFLLLLISDAPHIIPTLPCLGLSCMGWFHGSFYSEQIRNNGKSIQINKLRFFVHVGFLSLCSTG